MLAISIAMDSYISSVIICMYQRPFFSSSHYLTFIIETALASPSKQLSQDLFIAIHMWACQGPAIIYERARSMCQRDMKRPVITVEDIARV